MELLGLENRVNCIIVCGGGASLHMAIGSVQVVGVDIVNDYPDNIKHIQEYHKNFEFIIGDSIDMPNAFLCLAIKALPKYPPARNILNKSP